MLVFPQGIRLANSEDLLGIPGSSEMLDKVNMAKIEPGYNLFHSDDRTVQNYAEINIDSQYIWALFCSLCKRLLPAESQLVIGSIDDEESLSTGCYFNTMKSLELLEKFEFYLSNDCHIQFGLANVFSGEIVEVFVTATKHFKVWTDKIDILEDIMKEYGIIKTNDLQFIDEFSRTTINLEYGENFYGYQDLIDHLIKLSS
jgi:hypothetical protein